MPHSSIHPFRLAWQSDFPDHTYEPLYLANTFFGGLLDLSGSTMDLWSASVVAKPDGHRVSFPVTMMRLQVFYRTPAMREAGIWLGATGIHTADPRYTSDSSMPHLPQIRDCRQSLDLQTGIAATSGRLALGGALAPATLAVDFQTRILFLKDSPLLAIEITAAEDVEICVLPEPIREERFHLDLTGKGIHRLGNEIRSDITLRQSIQDSHIGDSSISHTLEPHGGEAYTVTTRVPNAKDCSLHSLHGLVGRGRVFATLELGKTSQYGTFDELAIVQSKRWNMFWEASSVRLPDAELLWQQRYHASLFYVEQSIGIGPTHPGGLAKPMLPYWFGCFHDTDTYLCRPLLESGRPAGPLRHLAYRHRTLDAARSPDHPGVNYPWETDPLGHGPVHEVPMNSAIIACEALLQAGSTGDPEARAKAGEIVTETFAYLASLLDTNASPLRFKPGSLGTFSETMIAEDACEARIAVRAVASALLETGEDSPLAQRILDELLPHRRPDGSYAITTGDEPLYLRCPSVTLGSFPLHHLPADEALGRALEDEHGRIIHRFAWLPHQASIVASQLRRSDAVDLLRHADVFYKPWHAYDEWENRRLARAAFFVTAAGGFCTALHHLILAETAPGEWSLFPGIPDEWQDLEFENLRTRHGWSVSATLKCGELTHVEATRVYATAPVLQLRIGDTLREFS